MSKMQAAMSSGLLARACKDLLHLDAWSMYPLHEPLFASSAPQSQATIKTASRPIYLHSAYKLYALSGLPLLPAAKPNHIASPNGKTV